MQKVGLLIFALWTPHFCRLDFGETPRLNYTVHNVRNNLLFSSNTTALSFFGNCTRLQAIIIVPMDRGIYMYRLNRVTSDDLK